MTLDELMVATLGDLVGDRVWPDVAEEKTTPFIIYSTFGGAPVNFIGGEQPDKANAWVQITAWSPRRKQVSALMAQIEAAMRARSDLAITVLSQPVSQWDPETKCRGAAQNFSIWVPAA